MHESIIAYPFTPSLQLPVCYPGTGVVSVSVTTANVAIHGTAMHIRFSRFAVSRAMKILIVTDYNEVRNEEIGNEKGGNQAGIQIMDQS